MEQNKLQTPLGLLCSLQSDCELRPPRQLGFCTSSSPKMEQQAALAAVLRVGVLSPCTPSSNGKGPDPERPSEACPSLPSRSRALEVSLVAHGGSQSASKQCNVSGYTLIEEIAL